MSFQTGDLTPSPDLQHEHATGPTRLKRPEYLNQIPPCNHACPTGEDIQDWLAFAQAGRFHDAWLSLVKNNPFPAISGRICYHSCETSCNRAQLDSAVSIHAVERFLGDLALEKRWDFLRPVNSSGKRVLIVGAGPCGLAAAYHLTRLGHSVKLVEANHALGGMMRFGIPAYRLPREVLDAELERLELMGIEIHLGRNIEDLEADIQAGKFDASLLALGAKLSRRIDIPGADTAKILDALGYLNKVSSGEEIRMGRRVAIYGGGNTAMDAARTARRLGAEQTMVIYRNDREHMAAHEFEAEEALNEDVKIHWLRRIKQLNGKKITVEVMRINQDGELEPTGEIEVLKADTLIMAVGQNVDSRFLKKIDDIKVNEDGSIEVDHNLMTGRAGIFAGGDMIDGERTATHAFGYGKRAAKCIDSWLNGESYSETHPFKTKQAIEFSKLHLFYRTDAPAKQQVKEEPEYRVKGFGEVVRGLDKSEVLFEAKRCFSCGNCFECDGCLAACPQKAIEKQGSHLGYLINYDLCTGCGVCVEQCPCHAMELVDEHK